MSETREENNMQFSAKQTSSIKMFLTLVVVAAFSGLLIVVVFQVTQPIIAENKKSALEQAVYEVLSDVSKVATFKLGKDKTLELLENDDKEATKFYAGYSAEGNLVGVAIEGQGQGYQDTIRVLYGYDPYQQTIVGLKVLESKETPGLGDKIEKDKSFLANFRALDVRLSEERRRLLHDIEVVKQGEKQQAWEISAITGATISSKAIGRILLFSAEEKLPLILDNLAILERQ